MVSSQVGMFGAENVSKVGCVSNSVTHLNMYEMYSNVLLYFIVPHPIRKTRELCMLFDCCVLIIGD